MIRVTVWNEFRHEQADEKVKEIYPKGIHGCIADFLGKDTELSVRTATLDMPEHGLTEDVLSETDVLVFWNHMFQDTFSRGLGKIFYFQPGHEEYPNYYIPYIQKIIDNAVHWCYSETRNPKPLDNTAVERFLEEED